MKPNSHMMTFVGMAFGCFVLIIFLNYYHVLQLTYGDELNPGLSGVNSEPYGVSYQEWIAKWWNWTAGTPKSIHPGEGEDKDLTQEKCSANQNGTVFFLPGTLSGKHEKTCVIPFGKSIFVPIVAGAADKSNPNLMTDQDLINAAKEGDNFSTRGAVLDGMKIKGFDGEVPYRTLSGPFNLTYGKDNIYDYPPGTFKAYADGWHVLLEPLSVGKHDLILRGDVNNPTKPEFNFAYEIIWHLIVKQ